MSKQRPNPKVPKIIMMGPLKSIEKAVKNKQDVKFPMHFWTTDTKQYGYLNLDGSLSMVGIPKLVGTFTKPIIVSELDQGIYTITGQHKITITEHTTYITSVPIIYMVNKTNHHIIKIKRITSASITDYVIKHGEVKKDSYITEEWLKDNGYETSDSVDIKLNALEASLKLDARAIAVEVFDEKIDDALSDRIEGIGDDYISSLFE